MSEQIEQAARAMADDWNPDRDPILTAMFRDYANTLAAAGLLTPSDTFASTKPSDAEHLLSVVETIKETGGSVQIRGVLITPCDTYGQPLTNVHPDADVDLLRRAAASERAAERHWPADMLAQAADTIERLRTDLAANPDADVAERIAEAWDEGYQAHEDEYWCGDGENPYRATLPEIPGFEGTRSALDGLTIRKEKTSD